MIIDRLENLEMYVGLNSRFAKVVGFLKANNLSELSDGKHLVDGDDVFVNIITMKGKSRDEAAMEYHRDMIDIQVPINTDETYGFIPAADLPPMEYVKEKDMAIKSGIESQFFVRAKVGQFVMFFPQDGHAPGISTEPVLKKAIFKIRA